LHSHDVHRRAAEARKYRPFAMEVSTEVNLLLIRHGHDMTTAINSRKELTAFLSADDGRTSPHEGESIPCPDIAEAPATPASTVSASAATLR
jgi:hypothetical protein